MQPFEDIFSFLRGSRHCWQPHLTPVIVAWLSSSCCCHSDSRVARGVCAVLTVTPSNFLSCLWFHKSALNLQLSAFKNDALMNVLVISVRLQAPLAASGLQEANAKNSYLTEQQWQFELSCVIVSRLQAMLTGAITRKYLCTLEGWLNKAQAWDWETRGGHNQIEWQSRQILMRKTNHSHPRQLFQCIDNHIPKKIFCFPHDTRPTQSPTDCCSIL